mmetsp:Transcript_14349/g.36046  ORF Transcript_14349/g.36046 Transcript_14349/m.36046 type:complete len:663 (-) Transcript_14349:113-2101(-)|eukprot:CAMPEP_0116102122 /NCGR_PEP_ID=MMETSP0327-20121206/13178_1 /TAXON_ID=44447 /ORGANISM="Pseudo-nitzschia delicatissima, Strain B596" /LENGTH=662 /DNA_ID=CAMNT_0003594135 /DNA_START=229 /DNA_END=2217 /DNA_ORIENTATION=+
MNISVEREASFEASTRSKFSVEREASFEVSNRKMKRRDIEDTIIESPVVENDAKTSDAAVSPTKVMDFIEGYPNQFVTPIKNKTNPNLSCDSFDPWGEEGEEDQRESTPVDFTPFDQPSGSDDDSSPKKVLFPEDGEPKENSILVEQDEVKKADCVDVNGFPNTSSTSDLYSACVMPAEFLEQKKDDEKQGNRFQQWLKQLPEGARVRAMHIRRQLMVCQGQGATSVVVFEDGVDPSAVEEKPKPLEGSESVFTYGSLKQFSASVITTTQDMLSRQSKAETQEQPETEEKSVATATPTVTPTVTSTRSIFKKLTLCSEKPSAVLKLYIDLYEKSAFETLMSDLTGNTQVKEIHVFRSWEQEGKEGKSGRARTKEDIGLLFKTIGSLPNLEILNLANFLAIDVHFVCLSEWQNANLKNIRIHLCRGALSKRLLSVLARLPALRDLTLEMNNSFPCHILLHSATLESLTIIENGFDIDNLHAMEIVQEIPKNETLKKLIIEPSMKPRTFKLLLSALSKNLSIEEFKFSLLPGPEADTTRVMNELARTLMSNAALKSIQNLNYEKLEVADDQTCDALMKALSENYIIEDFLVFDEEPWFKDRKERILRENKMEYESLLPHVFKCGNDDVDDDSTAASAARGIASLGDGVQRVATGALDLVGLGRK